MGGGAEKKKTNRMLDAQYAENTAQNKNYMNTVNTGLAGSTQRASDMYNSLYGGYQNFINGGGDYKGKPGGGGGGGVPAATKGKLADVEKLYRDFMASGGVDRGQFDQLQGNLKELGQTGGYSAGDRADIMGDVGNLRGIASSADVANRFRGGGVFDEFARTGGYSDQDISNIRTRSNSMIPSYYDVARNEAGRMASVQGGYGPGQSALFARMGRDAARQGQAAALDTELGIKDKVNAGRLQGAQGMSDAEAALQSARMQALTGASGIETNMLNSIAGNRTAASNAGANNELGMQGLIQSGKEFGGQGLNSLAQAEAARAAARSAQAAANAKWIAQFNRQGQEFGLEGMKSLYGMAPGEVGMYLDANLAGRNTYNSGINSVTGSRMQNNPQRDWLSTIGGLVGAAGGAMTGLGALGFRGGK